MEESIDIFRHNIENLSFESGWEIEYTLELPLLTIFNLLNPPTNKPKKKKLTKEEIKEKTLEMKKDWAKLQKRVLESQQKSEGKQSEN